MAWQLRRMAVDEFSKMIVRHRWALVLPAQKCYGESGSPHPVEGVQTTERTDYRPP